MPYVKVKARNEYWREKKNKKNGRKKEKDSGEGHLAINHSSREGPRECGLQRGWRGEGGCDAVEGKGVLGGREAREKDLVASVPRNILTRPRVW